MIVDKKLHQIKVDEYINSPFFHSAEKGCQIVDHLITNNYNNIRCKYCETHQTIVCKCGFEFGFHYNTDSKQVDLEHKNFKKWLGGKTLKNPDIKNLTDLEKYKLYFKTLNQKNK